MRNLTRSALQQRELALDRIGRILRSVTEGATAGVATREIRAEKTLAGTVAGVDDALPKAVEASNVALHRLTRDGCDDEGSSLKRALDQLETFEERFPRSVEQATEAAGAKDKAPWDRVPAPARQSGTASGTGSCSPEAHATTAQSCAT